MPQQLTPPNAAALAERIRETGIQLHLGKRTQGISRLDSEDENNQALQLELAVGESLPVVMVVISAGIRARDELARQCEIDVALDTGGIDQLLRAMVKRGIESIAALLKDLHPRCRGKRIGTGYCRPTRLCSRARHLGGQKKSNG